MRTRLSCQWLIRRKRAFSPLPFAPNPRLVLSGLAALTLAGCAAQPQRYAGNIDPRYGVAASPRVVAEGDVVPRGGGTYMVGKPYTVGGITYYPSERTYAWGGPASYYGTAKVKVEYIGRAGLGRSDDHKLFATLRRDGTPAGFGAVLVAARGKSTRTADLPENAGLPESREEQVAQIESPPPQPTNAPLPPARPFDLGTIPGAGVPIAPLPPHRSTLAALH